MSAQAKAVTVNVVDARKPQRIAIDLADALSERLAKIGAIASLLIQVESSGMANGALRSTARTICDLADEARDLINGKMPEANA